MDELADVLKTEHKSAEGCCKSGRANSWSDWRAAVTPL
jgi:hypothetical protein